MVWSLGDACKQHERDGNSNSEGNGRVHVRGDTGMVRVGKGDNNVIW